MPSIEDVAYSRDETVSAFRDFYGFMAKMYMDEADIMEPPPGGWPNITAAAMRGKSAEVVDLLRHLPYIRPRRRSVWNEVKIGPHMSFINWQYRNGHHQVEASSGDGEDHSGDNGDDDEPETESLGICETVPRHVVAITNFYERHDETLTLLDTQLGIVHWPECFGEILNQSFSGTRSNGTETIEVVATVPERIWDDACDYAPEEEEEWRDAGGTWAIADFFEVLKEQFRRLNFVPITDTVVKDVWLPSDSGLVAGVQAIYREHGWPEEEENFRKAECMAAVKAFVEREHPDAIVN